MKKYKLPKEGFERIRRQYRKLGIGMFSLFLIMGLGILMVSRAGFNFKSLLVMVPLIGASVYFGWRRGLKREEEAWNSYELIIKGKEIIQTQDNRNPIIIDKTQIAEIIKNNGFLVLKTGDSFLMLSIPQEIEEYDEIVAMLAEIRPIKQQSKQANKLLILKIGGFVLGMLSLMLVFFTSQKLTTLLLTGSMLMGILIWSIIVIQKGNIDKRLKRNSFVLILFIVSILGKIYHQLF